MTVEKPFSLSPNRLAQLAATVSAEQLQPFSPGSEAARNQCQATSGLRASIKT
jgi:hypothetical protein